MRIVLMLFLLFCVVTPGWAQDHPRSFAAESVALLDRELPQMNKAVAANDRSYFGPAVERVRRFLDFWNKHEGHLAGEQNPACMEAITDFLIAGLCKMPSQDAICEPATFFPKAERNIENCRAMAQRPASFK